MGIMDVDKLAAILQNMHTGAIKVHFIDSHTPSPTSLAIINARNYAFLDEAPAEERRTLAVHSQSLDQSFTVNKINQHDIDAFNAKIKPKVRDLDELQEWIFFMGIVWPDEALPYIEGINELLSNHRVKQTQLKGRTIYHSYKYESLVSMWVERPAAIEMIDLEPLVSNRLTLSGLLEFDLLHQRIPVAASLLQQVLLQLEVKGVLFQFGKDQWIERHLLAQLRKSQLRNVRRNDNVLSADGYQKYLQQWHFLSKPLEGIEGLTQVLRQWQGFAADATFWESQILKPRVKDYHGMMLDVVCQSGQFIWKRAHSKLVSEDLNQMTIQKTAVTFLEPALSHLFPAVLDFEQVQPKVKMVLKQLMDHGAQFVRELLAATDLMPVEIEQILIHLIKQGLVTSDGFQALRVFSQTPAERRRQLIKAKKYANNLGYLEMMGRWSFIKQKPVAAKAYVHMMLNRYGILSYDIWQQESMPVKWRKASFELQRMEARGEILAGRFVDNMPGMHYVSLDAYKNLMGLEFKMNPVRMGKK
jgi:ATP-dependent Lhr-like helicase